MKRVVGYVLGLFLLVVLAPSLAQEPDFDVSKSFVWLAEHCPGGNCQNSVMATAWYAMALRDSGYPDQAQFSVDYVKSKQHPDGCFPNNGCTVKDTVFALWMLDAFGEDTTRVKEYLSSALSAGLKDNWWLQVFTQASGTCRILYPASGGLEETQVRVEQGSFPDCQRGQPETFFDLNSCIIPGLVNNNPGVELTIDCSSLGPSAMISVIYNSGSNYYIMSEATTSKYVVSIQNGCYGVAKGGACDKETSLYANWLLAETNQPASIGLWVVDKYDRVSAVDNALVYLGAADQQLRESVMRDLVGLQGLDGGFNKRVFDTSLALLALKEGGSTENAESALAWLKSKRAGDGSWDNNVLNTAIAVYAGFAGANVVLPPLVIGGDAGPVCGDGLCDPTENSFSCSIDCGSAESPTCVENGRCELSAGEDSSNCPVDCFCGDGLCDSSESAFGSCEADCGANLPGSGAFCGDNVAEGFEECDGTDDLACPGECLSNCSCPVEEEGGGGFAWWIIGILVLLIVGVFIAYKRGMFTRKSGPSRPSGGSFGFLPPSKPELRGPLFREPPQLGGGVQRPSVKEPVKSQAEDELDRSLREAKKLLKKI